MSMSNRQNEVSEYLIFANLVEAVEENTRPTGCYVC